MASNEFPFFFLEGFGSEGNGEKGHGFELKLRD